MCVLLSFTGRKQEIIKLTEQLISAITGGFKMILQCRLFVFLFSDGVNPDYKMTQIKNFITNMVDYDKGVPQNPTPT
jgi:hypothetical protein